MIHTLFAVRNMAISRDNVARTLDFLCSINARVLVWRWDPEIDSLLNYSLLACDNCAWGNVVAMVINPPTGTSEIAFSILVCARLMRACFA